MRLQQINRYLLITLCYIALHIGGGLLGNYLNILANRSVYFWPPVGLSLALLLIFGYRYWPGIFLAAIITATITGASPIAALFFSIGSTVGPLVATYVLRNFLNFNIKMERLRDVMGLIFVALPIGSAVLATIVTTARLINTTVSPMTFASAWGSLWVSDILNNIIVCVPILLWLSHPLIKKMRVLRILEAFCLFASTFMLGVFIFTDPFKVSSPGTYLVFFPTIWATLRFGPREVATIVLFLSAFAIWGTSKGSGPFAIENPVDNLIYLRSFIFFFIITSMMLAASIHERRQLERRKNSFIGIASHELKTPLTSLKIITQLLKREAKDKKTKGQFETMLEQIDKLTDLTKTLLDLSKIQAEKFILHKEYTQLQKIINSAVKTVQYSIKTHKIIMSGTIKGKVYVDKERIGQVLINLLTNAIRHSPSKKEIHVHIEQKNNLAQIGVQDFGMGISKEKLVRIFERFYQISEGKELEGLGLGLFISSEIIKQHDGKIWVKSEEGKGSTFYFTLPIRKERLGIRKLAPKS